MCDRLGKIGFGDVDTSVVIDGNNINIDGTVGNVIDVVELLNGDINNSKGATLDIFKNEKFNNEKIIAPGSYGKYTFYVKNLTGQNITYDIKFLDTMTNPINMKYKLKVDNIYIKGNEDEFVSVSNLDIENIIVVEDSVNMFTLEWYWENNDVMDTYVGTRKEEQTYTLDVKIDSSLYIENKNEESKNIVTKEN